MVNTWSIRRFRILVLIVSVTGMSQGLLIPLLTTLLEEQGVSSSSNGLSAAALYAGILVMSPICAPVVKRIGYKRSIIIGLLITTAAVILFPMFTGIWIWSLLRFWVGVGDSLLHYATQLWITATAPLDERGKRISQYGFCYGLGFGIGPLGMNLLELGFIVPFMVLAVVLGITLYFTRLLDSGRPDLDGTEEKRKESVKLWKIYRIALIALCPPILYGLLETALAGNFPVYGLREGISKAWISVLISAFVWGSLAFQVPLGILGDKIGRKNILIIACFLGSVGMAVMPLLVSNVLLLFIAFLLVGGVVGSLFSLGLAYLTDLLPARYLPAANAVASVHFSVGSILGPYVGGVLIQWIGGNALFYFLSIALASFVLLAIFYRVSAETATEIQKTSITN
ncbi:MFS transporter [Paenactinomyces guangxiensis]|uniref:MFS transporter n=1 Tax=Paenactinomyces guangxiensis TaxID=1490290 RepID=A0A7W2A7R1_9BACL|nr:MFS transporter [Paenactinomyces guangxiensis]MBA4493382.1 MFS transporter [Paenactinomyces guangxiensis]MBH8590472.1 MFS transporter [Paenactinomyces guangxiensis]